MDWCIDGKIMQVRQLRDFNPAFLLRKRCDTCPLCCATSMFSLTFQWKKWCRTTHRKASESMCTWTRVNFYLLSSLSFLISGWLKLHIKKSRQVSPHLTEASFIDQCYSALIKCQILHESSHSGDLPCWCVVLELADYTTFFIFCFDSPC